MSNMDPILGVPKSIGQLGDDARAAEIPESIRCRRCEGTGNQLYRMFQLCQRCMGRRVQPTGCNCDEWEETCDVCKAPTGPTVKS